MARNTAVAVFLLCAVLLLCFPERADCGADLPARQSRQSPVAGSWANGYHRWFSFSCAGWNQFISGLHSHHNDGYEDRRFKFECRNLTITPEQYGSNYTSGYLNEYDAEVDFECPSHSVMREVQSAHSDWHMDRNWNFICMQVGIAPWRNSLGLHRVVGFCWSGCTWSQYNDWDDDVIIPTADWTFITGARSHHDNTYE
ncbi:Hypp1017 [Branchiostoma lanceolatum]|uniref:Hypp1017 protein n=1 Tax=Branchiostoma lanceolatum TaxID=7740 RepID=A0A8J9ZE80_BRALA|nr:Hypp1017 [Branchiostoma lanceolatum]